MPTTQKSRDNSSPENIEDDSMAVFNGEDQVCPYYVRINKKIPLRCGALLLLR